MVYRSQTSLSRNFANDEWIVVLRSDSEVVVGLRQVPESFDAENRMLDAEDRMLAFLRRRTERNVFFQSQKILSEEVKLLNPQFSTKILEGRRGSKIRASC